MSRPETWEKPRGRGDHFGPEEIARIRTGYDNDENTELLASELKCARRTINCWYRKFRAGWRPDRPSVSEAKIYPIQKERKPIPAPNAMPWCIGRLTARRA